MKFQKFVKENLEIIREMVKRGKFTEEQLELIYLAAPELKMGNMARGAYNEGQG